MKFYDCATAPSPRRVRIFMAEKGIEIPTIQVNLAEGEHLSPEFKAKNPRCTVPVLELDDGTCIAETLAICFYLEQMNPEPALMGTDLVQKARVLQWNHYIESDGFVAVAEAFRNAAPGLKGRALTGPENFEQIPALAERGRRRTGIFLRQLNDHLANHAFFLGDTFTMVDISALVVVDFCGWIKFPIPEDHNHLRRWHAQVSQRPSAGA